MTLLRSLRVRRWLTVVLMMASCGGGSQPGWRVKQGGGGGGEAGAPAKLMEFRPGGDAAERYNDPVVAAVPRKPLYDAVVGVVTATAEANGRAAPEEDPRLYAVAEDIAMIVAAGDPPPYDVVEFSLAHHGIIEPSPHLVIVRASAEDPDAVAEELRGRLPEVMTGNVFKRLGVASAPMHKGGFAIVLALQESAIEIRPIARAAPSGGTVTLRGKTLHPYKDPRVYVTGTEGGVTSVPLVRDGADGFKADVRCGGDGRIKVEVVAYNDAHDPNVLANFPVWCGVEPPTAIELRSGGATDTFADATDAEKIIFQLLNEDRRRAGLPDLAWDDRAAAVARKHSEDMRDNGFVAHVSPTTGSASDRAKVGGIVTGLVLENIARAYSPREAEEGLMNSPGHRANVLSREATHVGVGVAVGAGTSGLRELYVTQLFFRVPPKIGRAEAIAAVKEAVAAGREAAGRRRLEMDEELAGIAQRYADGLVAGEKTRAALSQDAAEAIDRLGYRFGAVVSVVQVVGDASQAESVGRMLDGDVTFAGIGVAQGKDEAIGEGALFVVVLGAKPR